MAVMASLTHLTAKAGQGRERRYREHFVTRERGLRLEQRTGARLESLLTAKPSTLPADQRPNPCWLSEKTGYKSVTA
jgi:hypothetical protein